MKKVIKSRSRSNAIRIFRKGEWWCISVNRMFHSMYRSEEEANNARLDLCQLSLMGDRKDYTSSVQAV